MKKKTTLRMLSLGLLFLLLLLSSCQRRLEKFSAYSLDTFDTVTSVVGYARSQEEFDAVAEEIFADLLEYHRLFTIYHRFEGMENLCTVNELVDGSHRVVTVDSRIVDMLLYAKEMYALTEGRVNIALGSVLSLWHEVRTEGENDPFSARLPDPKALAEAALHTDIEQLIIDEVNSTVFLADPAMRLDVGAIAKGYAVEQIARKLEEAGISGYVLNVGGNVRTIGTKADGTPWSVGIENPDGEDYLALLSLSGQSLVTSGSYQRYYIVDGKQYHHIIDPETLFPAEGYRSVSLIVEDSGLGDALSTALFCMDLSDGLQLIESLPGAEALWLLADGTIHTSSGFSDFTTP